MQSIIVKTAETKHGVLDIISKRWSPRSFSDMSISVDQMETILEAASWAASANNEQPWEYQYAFNGTKGFHGIWECLMPGNQPWAKNAAAFVVAIARTTFEANQAPNALAAHDLGMANAHLLLQAVLMDIYSHPMAGFDKVKITEYLKLTETQNPICVIALGYLDEAEKLEEPFKARELTPRARKPLSIIAKEI